MRSSRLGAMPPNTGKLAGMPNQPNATANGVIRISGTVMRLTLSGALAAPALRGWPRKVNEIWRAT